MTTPDPIGRRGGGKLKWPVPTIAEPIIGGPVTQADHSCDQDCCSHEHGSDCNAEGCSHSYCDEDCCPHRSENDHDSVCCGHSCNCGECGHEDRDDHDSTCCEHECDDCCNHEHNEVCCDHPYSCDCTCDGVPEDVTTLQTSDGCTVATSKELCDHGHPTWVRRWGVA